MSQQSLFPELSEPCASGPAPLSRPEAVRVVRPLRTQIEWRAQSLEQALPQDHPARAIWSLVERLDLGAFYAQVKAVVDGPGRPASDPRVLLALWVYATSQGVGSARKLARLCEEHDAYRWLRGGVPTDYHLLSDFRVANQKALDELLTRIVAVLMAEKLLSLERVAQDGVRLRASAGAGSFRRKARLEQCLEEARNQVERLAQEREQPDSGVSKRERSASERAARERQERVERALEQMPKVEAVKAGQKRKLAKGKRELVTEARVSTTDAEARVMKMPDGGFRPAFNGQVASEVGSQFIVGVALTNQGSDGGQAEPMEEQVKERTGKHPSSYLVDGGFVKREDITSLEQKGVKVYAPTTPPRTKTSGREQSTPRPDDTPEVASWRVRMQSEEAKAIYKERASTSECVNAQIEARYCLERFLVRGLEKALSVLLLVAIAHNLLRWIALTTP